MTQPLFKSWKPDSPRTTYWEVSWKRPGDRETETHRFTWVPGKNNLNEIQAQARAFAIQKVFDLKNGFTWSRDVEVSIVQVEEVLEDQGYYTYEHVLNSLGSMNSPMAKPEPEPELDDFESPAPTQAKPADLDEEIPF